MNFDESSGPNRSLSSMPDHSHMPPDFHNFSGVEKGPSAVQSPNTSYHYKKKKETSLIPNAANKNPVQPSRGASIYSDVYQTSNYYGVGSEVGDGGNAWGRENQDNGGVRERGNQPRAYRDQSERNLGLSSNLQPSSEPFSNDEGSETEVDQSYKTFLKLKRLYIYWVFNVICVLIMALNIFFAYSTDQVHFKYLEDIDSQFQSRLIIDMNLMEKGSDCSGLYTSPRMGKWPGYSKVCQCESAVSEGECNYQQVSDGCRSVGPLAPLNITSWEGKKICTRKSEGTVKEYYQKLTISSSGESSCGGDWKKCTVSTNGNSVCMGRFEFCPIVKVLVVEDPINDFALKKWKGQLHFKNKTLLFDSEESKGTSFLDLLVGTDECAQYEDKTVREACESEKMLLDRISEYEIVKDNTLQSGKYEILKYMNKNMALYGKAANYLDMCKFNKTFNPIILSNELGNWDRVKTLRFINPFFVCSLIILNYVRTSVLDYLNTKTAARTYLRRKKELYNIFGFFTGSSVMITCQVLIILYYIFWGYLLLNQSRLIGQRWLDMSCIKGDLRSDIEMMMGEISKVEAYNMVTIGPMIVCCILEALFAQYKMLTQDVMDHLRE